MTDLERLENDAAALAVLERLAEIGAEVHTNGRELDPLSDGIRAAYQDGAGGMEPEAVLAWVRERKAETENTLAALDGTGPPLDVASGFAWLREQIDAVAKSHDVTESHLTLFDAAKAVLSVAVDGNQMEEGGGA